MLLPWADGVTQSTHLFIGGVMGDLQEGDKYTGEPQALSLACVIAVMRLANVTLIQTQTLR